MSCCGTNAGQVARMAPSEDAFAFFGDAMNRVLMRYTGKYDSEYINCSMTGNHYLTGTGQEFLVDAGDVDSLIEQGVAERVNSEQLVTPEVKAKAK